jgi:hypothetical protein
MSVIFMTGAEADSIGAETYGYAGGASISSTPYTGGRSYCVDVDTTGVDYFSIGRLNTLSGEWLVPLSTESVYVNFWFMFDVDVSTRPGSILEIRGSRYPILGLAWLPDGTIRMYSYSVALGSWSVVATSTSTISIGEWNHISVMLPNGAGGAYSLHLNGELEFSGTYDFGVYNIQLLYVGARTRNYDNGSTTSDAHRQYYDDVSVDDSELHLLSRVSQLVPEAPGYTLGGWGVFPSGEGWDAVDEIPHDADTTYIYQDQANHRFACKVDTPLGAGIPSYARVIALQGNWCAKAQSGTPQAKYELYDSGDSIGTTGVELPASYAWYYYASEINPSTDVRWRMTELRKRNCQLAISTLVTLFAFVRCTAMYLQVLWEDAGRKVMYTPHAGV